MRRALLVVTIAAVAAAATSTADAATLWKPRMDAAKRYAENRAGLVSFALVDEAGGLHGYRAAAVAPSASVLKAMLLVAYLRRPSVRDRALTTRERSLLGRMIRRSDNAAATTVLAMLGPTAVSAFARRIGMFRFRLHLPIWGQSEITAAEQARFFSRIDMLVPLRHRAYALRLLETVVPSQRWGVGRVAHPGWRLYFKGGWGSGTGLVDHQIALLTAGGERVSLAILTRFNPDHAYGKETLRGVASRLLRGLPRARFTTAPAALFAHDRGYTATLDAGCATVRLRSLATGARVAIPAGTETCDASARLVLGASRALWSDGSQVLTATLDDPTPASLAAGAVVESLAGGGTTLVFTQGEGATVVGGPTCSVPEEAVIAADAGRIAVGSAGTVQVLDASTCDVEVSFAPGGSVEAVALGGDLLAVLVRESTGAKRIDAYRLSTPGLERTSAVSTATAPTLEAVAGWVVYRVGRAFVALGAESGRKWILWRPRRPVVGFGASARRLAWAESFAGRARVWTLTLPL